jgi:hypothetical protein
MQNTSHRRLHTSLSPKQSTMGCSSIKYSIQNPRSDPLSITDVLQRVLIQQYQVSELAHFNCAKRIFNPQKLCRVQGGTL